jgi:D-alanyl-D-alanine carboxypeptidase
MNFFLKSFSLSFLALCLFACESPDILPPETYQCSVSFADSSQLHPRATDYQRLLDENRQLGLAGAVLLVKDRDGLWQGASGKADLANNIDMQVCHRHMIASISKIFTATTFFYYVDQGLVSPDDFLGGRLPESQIGKVANASGSQLFHLLSHTSGIPDYYSMMHSLDRFNRGQNDWSQEEVLTYAQGLAPTNGIGETYRYSNTNYLLLGMVIEAVSGKTLKEAYAEAIFDPLGLESAYYDLEAPIPANAPKGYADLYGDGKLAESEFLYGDEMRTGDGGIAINAHDLARFIEALDKGELISSSSLAAMKNWFDLPEEAIYEDLGETRNGYGLEYFEGPGGYAIGHTGAVDGFLSILLYFPEQEATFVLLVNSASYDGEPRLNIYKACMELMFD